MDLERSRALARAPVRPRVPRARPRERVMRARAGAPPCLLARAEHAVASRGGVQDARRTRR
eukprot:5616956-Alexandrium_andersonii.AAC.1